MCRFQKERKIAFVEWCPKGLPFVILIFAIALQYLNNHNRIENAFYCSLHTLCTMFNCQVWLIPRAGRSHGRGRPSARPLAGKWTHYWRHFVRSNAFMLHSPIKTDIVRNKNTYLVFIPSDSMQTFQSPISCNNVFIISMNFNLR